VALDTPDEAIGLPTALLSAGADAVIASQWAVGDGAAGVLIRILHRTLAEGGGSPAAALRRAQIQLRDATNADLVSDGFRPAEDSASLGPLARRIWAASRPFAHPSDWAAFTLTGL
jgi:CHAT domain-containing protein